MLHSENVATFVSLVVLHQFENDIEAEVASVNNYSNSKFGGDQP